MISGGPIPKDLVLLLPENPELIEEDLWRLVDSLDAELKPLYDAVRIPAAEKQRSHVVRQTTHIIQAKLQSVQLDDFRGAFVDRSRTLKEQLKTLLHAKPLPLLATVEDSPLTEFLEDRLLETWFQPIYSTNDSEIWGYECLIRGKRNNGEIVSPRKLLDWAWNDELRVFFDRVSREVHLRSISSLDLGNDHKFLLNFFPSVVGESDHSLEPTANLAQKLDIPESNLEVVETEQIADRQQLKRLLNHYRDLGFGIGLDDIGSAYSGLVMMGDLEPDIVKIDRSITSQVDEKDTYREICAALLRYSRNVPDAGIILAEGVENEEQFRILQDMGIELYQGYLFGHPAPKPHETVDWVP